MKSKMILFTLIGLLILTCPMTAFAHGFDGNRTGSISVNLLENGDKSPMVGAEFDVYYIATVGINTDNKLNYIYTEIFERSGIALDDYQLADKLSVFVEENHLSGTRIVTDSNGAAVYSDLSLGLYLVKQIKAVDGYALCKPFLVTVPIQNESGFVYDVNATPKMHLERLVTINIKKVWNADQASGLPDSVTVQLLCDGIPIETVTLNHGNNWQVTFTDMPESDGYSIQEVNVPKGFTATYSEHGLDFTVTNTALLAQTGQLIWPIPVFAALGMFFLVVGFVILRKPGNANA